jgi:hypothetical protein
MLFFVCRRGSHKSKTLELPLPPYQVPTKYTDSQYAV